MSNWAYAHIQPEPQLEWRVHTNDDAFNMLCVCAMPTEDFLVFTHICAYVPSSIKSKKKKDILFTFHPTNYWSDFSIIIIIIIIMIVPAMIWYSTTSHM